MSQIKVSFGKILPGQSLRENIMADGMHLLFFLFINLLIY